MKLIIKNCLEEDGLYYDFYDSNIEEFVKKRRIKSYDEEKWKNGSVYDFKTLKEMGKFIKTCDIDFTEEYAKNNFSRWFWEEIDIEYHIDDSEDNLIILSISSHEDFR